MYNDENREFDPVGGDLPPQPQQDRTDLPEEERCRMAERIHMLTAMWRETRDLAVLTERYYERGYRRNARYTL